ncbi:MAG: phage tail terminator-like protein [Candidatus Latescibacteria bacterium]|jgi:hypothetical protein|nr:phage tail terminator-like protein [Candidatus Latescibacterota bacterium]
MALTTTQTTLFTRWKAQWDTLRPNVPVAYPNVEFDPDGTSYDPDTHQGWVRIGLSMGESYAAATGGTKKRYRNPGVLWVQVFTELNQGNKLALQIADDVATALRGVTVSGVVLLATSINEVGRSGPWYQVNANTRFRYDDLVTVS